MIVILYTQNLGPKNLSKSCQADKFLMSQTCHHDGDDKDNNNSMHFYAFLTFWAVSKLVT